MTAPGSPIKPTEAHRCDGSGRLSRHEVAVLREPLKIVLAALGNQTHDDRIGGAALYLWECVNHDSTTEDKRMSTSEYEDLRWRVGPDGRVLHAMSGDDPDALDDVIGMMDSSALAAHVVHTHNAWIGLDDRRSDGSRP